MRLTHRHIEVFRTVMLAGQVTRAAELLHTSQPTVSRELARLEQLVGYPLFERDRGRMRPTVRAMALLEEVEASFVGLDRIAAHALSLQQYARGRLQLACLPALAQALVPEAVAAFAAKCPEASVTLLPMETLPLEAALTEQRVDLGLSEHDAVPDACLQQPLLRTQEVCVLPSGHALAAKASLVPSDFEGLPFVSLAPADPYRQRIDQAFADAGVARQLRVESASAASVCALVAAGLGVALVNPVTALAMAGNGLVLRRFSVPIAFNVNLVLPQWRAVHPLRDALTAALHATAAQVQRELDELIGCDREADS
jgi:DNA-binding transcriptional LysR family regulator